MMPRAALFPSISAFQSLVSCLRVSGIAFTQLITHTLYSTHSLYITRWYVLGAVDNQRCLMWHEFCLTVHSSVGRWLDRWLRSEVGSDMIGAWRKELRDFPGGEELRLWASTSESTGLISGHGLRSHMLCTQKKRVGGIDNIQLELRCGQKSLPIWREASKQRDSKLGLESRNVI